MKARTFASPENYNPIVAREDAGGSGDNDVFALMARDANEGNEASFRIYVGAGNTKVTARSNIILSTDTWYHLVGTYDGADVRVYLDGIEKGNAAQSGTLSTEATRIALGKFSNNFYVNFDGLIDEVRIYDRALSPAEITALAAAAPTDCGGPTTTIDNVAPPGSVTIAPGAPITDLDNFSLVASIGTDTVTAATVTLVPAGAFNNIGQADITDVNDVVQCTAITDPVSNILSFTGCSIPVTTSITTFKVRITPKTHANMPAVPGASYDVTGTVTAFTSTNTQAGTDSGSAEVTVDNFSPSNVTVAGATPGDTQVTVNWTNPVSDFSNVLILRKTATIGDVPTEGSTPTVNDPVGSSVVAYIAGGTSFIDTGLINGTTYFYRIFAKDPYGNYADTGIEVSATPTGAGPIAHWTFDEGTGLTAADSAGTNDGTLTNGPAWTCVAGGNALDFDGMDDYTQTTSNQLKTEDNFTISAWFKTDTTLRGPTLIWQGNSAGNGWGESVDNCADNQEEMHISIGAISDANALLDNKLSFFHGCTVTSAGGSLNVITDFTDTTNWNFVAVTVSNLGTSPSAEMFLNGVSVATDTGTTADTPRTNFDTNLRIGRPGTSTREWDGAIDDVRIYDRVLTPAEITALAASAPTDCAPAVTSVVAEISPNDVTTSSTGNSFSYDIDATIGVGDTGVDKVTIAVPATFGAPTVTDVLVNDVSVARSVTITGNDISIDLTAKVIADSKITVLFDANAPTTQDSGVAFTSTVEDSGTGYAAQATTEGNGDGDAVDANSWTVTTTDGSALTPLGRYCFNEAGSGTAPLTVLDDTANPVNLDITYDTIAWSTHADGHLGLNAATDPHVGVASGVANGTKYSTNLDGATQVTFSVVADWLPAADTQRIGGFFRSGSTKRAYIMVGASGEIILRFQTQGGAQISTKWPTSWEDGVRRVFHVVFDSDHPTDTSRVRLYMNGVDQGIGTIDQGTWPTPGAGLDFNAADDLDLSFLNELGLTKPLHGTVYYYAVYDSELTDAEIASDAAALLADDDCAGTAGPIAHWTFDEGMDDTAADSSGNGYDATLGTSAGPDTADPTWVCVAGGYALSFDGTNDVVDAGSPAGLDDLGPLTVTAWIKPDSSGAAALQQIVSKSNAANDTGRWFVELDNTGEDDALEFNKQYNSSDVFRVTSDGTVTYDTWQHVAATWDDSSTGTNIHIYKDGTEAGYQSTNNGSSTQESDAALLLVIGNRADGSYPFWGLIDDVRVYDRVLSGAEISALAAAAPTDCGGPTTTIDNVAPPGSVTIAPGAPNYRS